MGAAPGPGKPKYLLVADLVRAQVEDGTLRPGQLVPSGYELSTTLGPEYLPSTCHKGLRFLADAGVLTRRGSGTARFRVPVPGQAPAVRALVAAADALSAGLAVRRRAARLTQAGLAGRMGVSFASVRQAETRLLWQSRGFWECADTVLSACRELLRLHDAYLAAKAGAPPKADVLGVALTAREQEIAVLYARERKTVAGIAVQLGIAEGSVHRHMVRIHSKAGTGGSSRGARLRLAAWLQHREPERELSGAAAGAGAGE